MNRALLRGIVVLVACGAGLGCGEFALRSYDLRCRIGELFGCGKLLVLVDRAAIYETDVEGEWQADLDAAGAHPEELDEVTKATQKTAVTERLVNAELFAAAASGDSPPAEAVARQFGLFEATAGDRTVFAKLLRSSGLSAASLLHQIAANIRARAWIEREIAPSLRINDAEVRQQYDSNPAVFTLPVRLRASHIFVAAPDGSPPEVIDAKRKLIDAVSARLKNGEPFAQLAAQLSEDEATKRRGGDLNFFSASRMIPEFWEAAARLPIGEVSTPIRTHLGFHIVQVTDTRPAEPSPFEQVRAEIGSAIANERRPAAVAGLIANLRSTARITRLSN
jgi:hypothetical protein